VDVASRHRRDGGTDSIWFSAGIDNEQHGLIGVLRKP
jgi:hypothetical protein